MKHELTRLEQAIERLKNKIAESYQLLEKSKLISHKLRELNEHIESIMKEN